VPLSLKTFDDLAYLILGSIMRHYNVKCKMAAFSFEQVFFQGGTQVQTGFEDFTATLFIKSNKKNREVYYYSEKHENRAC
jgi:hypothetical protein